MVGSVCLPLTRSYDFLLLENKLPQFWSALMTLVSYRILILELMNRIDFLNLGQPLSFLGAAFKIPRQISIIYNESLSN